MSLKHTSYRKVGSVIVPYVEYVEPCANSVINYEELNLSTNATYSGPQVEQYCFRGAIQLIQIDSITGGALTITPWLQTFSPISGQYIDTLSLQTITTAGNYTIEIYPGIDTGSPANPHYSHNLPPYFRFQLRFSAVGRTVVGRWSTHLCV